MAKEPYDYLSTIAADYNATLSITAQGTLTEEGFKNQVIHISDDNTEERITLSTGSVFFISWDWNILSESDAGTVLDFYHDTAKANGMGNSFKFAYDGHTYVVRFDCRLTRSGGAVTRWGIPQVRMRILGRIVDA